MIKKIRDAGAAELPGDAAALAKQMEAENAKWKKVIDGRQAGAAMTRDELKGKIQTVLGPIEPEALGRTLMHEHVLCDIRPPGTRADNDLGPEITLENVWQINYGRGLKRAGRKYMLDLEDIATREVAMMKHDGGDAIVELTCGGLSPDPGGPAAHRRRHRRAPDHGLRLLRQRLPGSEEPRPHASTISPQEMIGQILHGAWGTDVRAGMIGEIGCQAPWTDTEKRVMQAALIAAAETGASINVHPGRDPDQPQEVADFIKAAGHPTERVVISHIDRTIFDEARLLRLADSGVTIEFDLFGQEASYYGLSDIDMPNDATRLKLIRALIDHGHLDRVVISHDICYRTRLASFGGHGYGHIFRNVVPMMKKRGYSEDEIDAILVRNPRRLLTFV